MAESYWQQAGVILREARPIYWDLWRIFAKNPARIAPVFNATADWMTKYFGAQGACGDRPRYLVYTDLDHRVPFRPEEDIAYNKILPQLAVVARRLAEMDRLELERVSRGIVAMNDMGRAVFERHPTVMPRHEDHDRLSLKIVQYLDQPLNCCPSLHIAYSAFIHNVGERLFSAEDFAPLREITSTMVNSVLYTKQHALVDVSFGLLCAKLACEGLYPGHAFNDFSGIFEGLKARHPAIDYDWIAGAYREGLAGMGAATDFTAVVGGYLEAGGYVMVEPGQVIDRTYFDRRLRALVGF